MLSKKLLSVVFTLLFCFTSTVSLAGNMSVNDKDALKGLKTATAVFDITTANPKKLNF